MKKLIFVFITLVVTVIPLSCEDSILFVDCSKCNDNTLNRIEIKVTLDEENPIVPLTIYLGTLDKGEILFEDTAIYSSYYTLDINFDEQYSAVAKYKRGGRVIYAVDGQKLTKKLDKNSCSNPCYIIKGDVLDLRLR